MQTIGVQPNQYTREQNRFRSFAAAPDNAPGQLDRLARQHEDDDKSGKISNRLAATIFYFAAGLCVLAVAVYYLAALFGDGISRGGHSASMRPIEMVIGNSALNIPENVIRFANQRHSGAHERVELYLHWPLLTGYSDALKTAFSHGGGQSELIFMSLEPRTMSLDMSGRIEPIYTRFFDGKAQKAHYGLIRQPLSADGGFVDEDLYIESGSPYPYAVRCVRPQSTISTPFCIRDIHIGKDLMLTYRYHIRHLSEWLAIDRNVRNFANKMLVSG